MKKVYQLQVSLTVDTAHKQEIIAKAQEFYSERGGDSDVDDDGRGHPIPAEDAITGIDEAVAPARIRSRQHPGHCHRCRISGRPAQCPQPQVLEAYRSAPSKAVLQLTGHSTDGSTGNEAEASAREGPKADFGLTPWYLPDPARLASSFSTRTASSPRLRASA